MTAQSSLSREYSRTASISCFWLLRQAMPRAFARALESAGKSMEARMAMIAMTTRSSIKVKDFFIVSNVLWGENSIGMENI